MNSPTTLKKGGINAITQPHPNFARNKDGGHNPNTIHDCTAKKANMINAAIISATRDCFDIPSNADTFRDLTF